MKKILYNAYLSIFNHIICKVPSFSLRHFVYRNFGRMYIGSQTYIQMGLHLYKPWNITIGSNVAINQNVTLDGRGELVIGNNVNISGDVKILTADHEVQSSEFNYREGKVVIEDYVWLSSNSIILPGVKVGKGAVVAAGAVVSKDIDEYTIVGGIPARKIGTRSKDLQYNLKYKKHFH